MVLRDGEDRAGALGVLGSLIPFKLLAKVPVIKEGSSAASTASFIVRFLCSLSMHGGAYGEGPLLCKKSFYCRRVFIVMRKKKDFSTRFFRQYIVCVCVCVVFVSLQSVPSHNTTTTIKKKGQPS